jgi:putative tryptophan/tyrosine transport system substrate-binding protein
MRRREFTLLLGSALAAWPLAAHPEQNTVKRIAILAPFNKNDPESQVNLAAFRQRLAELGWAEGRNVAIDYRFASGSTELIGGAAADLVASSPDVIFAASNVSIAPLQKVTTAIPIIFTQVSDPVGSGFVASLAKPGGNITGFQGYEPPIGGKWLEVLHEIAPGLRRVAVLLNPNVSANIAFLNAADSASKTLEVTVAAAGVRTATEIDSVVSAFVQEPAVGMIVTPSPFTNTAENRGLIFALAERLRLPTIYPYRLTPSSSGLISYSYDQVAQWQGGPSYVDRVLRGAKPADLPVQAPTKYEMVINRRTAEAIGLKVPAGLLARADEVIE